MAFIPNRRVRRAAPFLVCWTALCIAFYLPVLLGQERLPTGDLLGQVYAFARFQAGEVLRGRLPAWSPGSYGGIPFAADVQSATLYPPRWLTILAPNGAGLSYYAIELEGIAHIWLGGVFVYMLVAALTRRHPAALVSSLAFGLGGYLTSYPLQQLPILETITWLPLILLMLYRAVTRRYPVPPLLAAGGLLALSLTAGHPQTFLHVGYTSLAYYCFLTLRARWHPRSLVGYGLLVAAVAAGMSTGSWLPALVYSLRTQRADVDYRFVSSGLPLRDWAQAFLPGALTVWSPQYVGVVALAAALYGWASRAWARYHRAECVFWAGVALVAGWMALGNAGILFEIAYRVLPGLAFFRQQERWLGVVSLALAILAGLGTATWLSRDGGESWQARVVGRVAVGMGIGLALSVLSVSLATSRPLPEWARMVLPHVVLCAAAVCLFWLGRGRWAGVAVVALLAIELGFAGISTRDWEPLPPPPISPPRWVNALHAAPNVRFDSDGLFHANLGELYGVEDIRGISPLRMQALEALEALPRERLWQLLGVGHVLAPRGTEHSLLDPVLESITPSSPGPHREATLYRVQSFPKRAWMVYDVVPANDVYDLPALLGDEGVDLDRQVVLRPQDARTVQAFGVPGRADPSPSLVTRRSRPDVIEVEVDTASPGVLVLSEWHYPGWRAYVNGQRVDLVQANMVLQGVVLPAGHHHVVWRYVPLDLYTGIAVSLMAAALTLVAWRRWRRATVSYRDEPAKREAIPGRLQWAHPSPGATRVLALAIILLGFALRLACIDCAELRGDEAFSYFMSSRSLSDIIPALLRQGGPHSPLHYLVLHLWMRVAGEGELALRFPALLTGVALLPGMLILARRWGTPRVGLVAAGMAATAQSLVWLGQDARSQYAMALLFGALSIVLLQDALRRGGAPLWIAYTIVSALAVYSHFYGAFAIFAHLLVIVADRVRGRSMLAWATSYGGAGILVMVWMAALWPGLHGAGQLSDPAQPNLLRYLVKVGTWLTLGDGLDHWLGRWVFVLTLGLAIVGGRYLLRHRPSTGWLLLGWLGSATLGIYAVLFRRDTFNTFYIAVAAPAWWLLLAWGIEALWSSPRRGARLLGMATLSVLVAFNVLSLVGHCRELSTERKEWYRCAAAYVHDVAREGDAFVVNAPDPSIHYYLRHQDLPRPLMPEAPGQPPESVQADLDDLSKRYDRLWFVPYRSSWDPEQGVRDWLEHRALLEQWRQCGSRTISVYHPATTAADVMLPAPMSFGDLFLSGAHLTIDGNPVTTDPVPGTPGSLLQVTLDWRARANIGRSYTVFVHVVDGRGDLIAQHDGIPVFGLAPTWTWQAGSRVLDRHEVRLPDELAHGTGRVFIGIYDTETLQRVPLEGGNDALELAVITFAP